MYSPNMIFQSCNHVFRQRVNKFGQFGLSQRTMCKTYV